MESLAIPNRRGGPDPRTDVWSFGIVLYEMLTGVRPFPGEDSAVLVQAIRHAQAPPLRWLRPDAPDALATLVTRCLSKLPAERYTNAGEVLADLPRTATDV